MDQKSLTPLNSLSSFQQGLLDGRLNDELSQLSQEQLTEVALLLASRIEGQLEDSS